MNLRQAAQQALEALENDAMQRTYAGGVRIANAAIALRAALAEPEQEPDGISWLKRDSGYFTAPTPRKPLTDEEIVDIWAGVSMGYDDEINIIELARAIERHHGIGEQT